MIIDLTIQKANALDVPEIYALIKDLAIYEKEPQEPSNPYDIFLQEGTGSNPHFHVLVAKNEDKVIGIALYYYGYSTWKGRMLYLDDLVVSLPYRRHGIGRLLMNALLQEARDAKVNQVRWHVLDWNEPAIALYNTMNVSLDASWITVKVEKEMLY